MSVVRDILGVKQKSDAAAIASVMSSIAATAPSKKRKSFKPESREVASLRDTMNVIPIGRTQGGSGRPRRSWRWVPYRNSARGGDEINIASLAHWDYRGGDESPVSDDYTGAKFNVQVEVPDIESILTTSVASELLRKHNLRSIDDIRLLFNLLSQFDLRFPVAVDRFNSITGLSLSMTDVKDIYYSMYSESWPSRKCKYSAELDDERREILQESLTNLAVEGLDSTAQKKKEEKRLVAEIKELEDELKQTNDSFFSDIVTTSVLWSMAPPVTAASLQKKPPGYEHVAKNLSGLIGSDTSAIKSGSTGSSSVGVLLGSFLKHSGVDFSGIKALPNFCSSLSSHKLAEFFHELSELLEKEKALNSFIKKRDIEIKVLVKNS